LKQEIYQLSSSENSMSFLFTSEGPKGKIEKLILFQATHIKNVFNLAFGDINTLTKEIDDSIVSNNGDSSKVLITVAAAVYTFTETNKQSLIYLKGSTRSRTRLYQMGISRYLQEKSRNFVILAEVKGDWVNFERQLNCESFLVSRK